MIRQKKNAYMMEFMLLLLMAAVTINGKAFCPHEVNRNAEYLGVRLSAPFIENDRPKCVTFVKATSFKVKKHSYLELYETQCQRLFNGTIHRVNVESFASVQKADSNSLSTYSGYELVGNYLSTIRYEQNKMPEQFPNCLKNATVAKCQIFKLRHIEANDEKTEDAYHCYADNNDKCTHSHPFFAGCYGDASKCIRNDSWPLCRTFVAKKYATQPGRFIDSCRKRKWNYFACIHSPLKKCAPEPTARCSYNVVSKKCMVEEQKLIKKEGHDNCIKPKFTECQCSCEENQWSPWIENCTTMTRQRYRAFNGLMNLACLDNLNFCCKETVKLSTCQKDTSEESPCEYGIPIKGNSDVVFCNCYGGYSGPTCSELQHAFYKAKNYGRSNMIENQVNSRKSIRIRRAGKNTPEKMDNTTGSSVPDNETATAAEIEANISKTYEPTGNTPLFNETSSTNENGTAIDKTDNSTRTIETSNIIDTSPRTKEMSNIIELSTEGNGTDFKPEYSTEADKTDSGPVSLSLEEREEDIDEPNYMTQPTKPDSKPVEASPQPVDPETSEEEPESKSSVGLIAGIVTGVIIFVLLGVIMLKGRQQQTQEVVRSPATKEEKPPTVPATPAPASDALVVLKTAIGDIDGPQSMSLASEQPSDSDREQNQ